MDNNNNNNNNNNNFEDLIKAIKDSSKPTVELAKILQDRFKPVAQSKLRDPDISKLNFGDVSYEVNLCERRCTGENLVLEYRIKNEIVADQGCIQFVKGMIYHIYDTDYALTRAIECGDKLFVTFTVTTDKVLI